MSLQQHNPRIPAARAKKRPPKDTQPPLSPLKQLTTSPDKKGISRYGAVTSISSPLDPSSKRIVIRKLRNDPEEVNQAQTLLVSGLYSSISQGYRVKNFRTLIFMSVIFSSILSVCCVLLVISFVGRRKLLEAVATNQYAKIIGLDMFFDPGQTSSRSCSSRALNESRNSWLPSFGLLSDNCSYNSYKSSGYNLFNSYTTLEEILYQIPIDFVTYLLSSETWSNFYLFITSCFASLLGAIERILTQQSIQEMLIEFSYAASDFRNSIMYGNPVFVWLFDTLTSRYRAETLSFSVFWVLSFPLTLGLFLGSLPESVGRRHVNRDMFPSETQGSDDKDCRGDLANLYEYYFKSACINVNSNSSNEVHQSSCIFVAIEEDKESSQRAEKKILENDLITLNPTSSQSPTKSNNNKDNNSNSKVLSGGLEERWKALVSQREKAKKEREEREALLKEKLGSVVLGTKATLANASSDAGGGDSASGITKHRDIDGESAGGGTKQNQIDTLGNLVKSTIAQDNDDDMFSSPIATESPHDFSGFIQSLNKNQLVVGVIAVESRSSSMSRSSSLTSSGSRGDLEVTRIGVHPVYRSRGIASLLLANTVTQFAKEQGYNRICMKVSNLHEKFERMLLPTRERKKNQQPNDHSTLGFVRKGSYLRLFGTERINYYEKEVE